MREERVGYAERSFIALRDARQAVKRTRAQVAPTMKLILHCTESIVYALSANAEQLEEILATLKEQNGHRQ